MLRRGFLTLIAVSLICGCDTGAIKDNLDAIGDAIQDPPRKQIDTSIMGVSAYANDQRFGSIASQFQEVQNNLRLNHVRVLFAWNDQVQGSPLTQINFSFYDEIAASIPQGSEALVILTGVPTWMYDTNNWIDGNPRTTFVREWVETVVKRYANNPRLTAFQIWNEPNMDSNPDNVLLGLNDSPDNYLELLALAYSVTKDAAPQKSIVTAATTAINQNFPDSLNYTEDLIDAGAANFADVVAIHYYGKQYENVTRSGGIADTLKSIPRPIWVTESGAQGFNDQLAYVERTWPFLREKIPNISRFYYYQFTEVESPERTYALRSLDQVNPLSDLYIYLRDRL